NKRYQNSGHQWQPEVMLNQVYLKIEREHVTFDLVDIFSYILVKCNIGLSRVLLLDYMTLGKQWWDPYETSHGRQFVYRPNSAAEILCPTSTSFIDSYSKSGPFGSTVYNQDFSWKSSCKPECIRTGTASGHRRNNPHPSQSFMMWRLPRDTARSSEYVGFPWKCPPSEEEINKALTAQYRSTYRCDFMGMLQGKTSLSVKSRVYKKCLQHVHTQQKRSHLTNYDRFCGKRASNVACVIKSLLPQELQQLHRILPEDG
uniref:Uncharacterized protein n=1 Tax=Dicentrarchus labrax TaxID=13489 RepID=A0A8P4JVW6_DICLA